MVAVPTTRMSSRGQVVIPEAIRIGCGFGEGTTFAVVAKVNAVMLLAIVGSSRGLFRNQKDALSFDFNRRLGV